MLRRYAGSLGVAALVTIGLSVLMQSLVWRSAGDVGERERMPALEYIWVKRESETEIRRRERPKEVDPEHAAQPPKLKVSEVGPPMQRVARDAFETAGSYPGAKEAASRWLSSIEAELGIDTAGEEPGTPVAASAAGGSRGVGLE